MKRLALILIVLALVLAPLTACTTTPTADNPPVITSLSPSTSNVAPGGSSTITCVASDADGDTLSYTWSATGGTISGVGSIVTWVAPAITGTFTISVTVADDNAETAAASCYVTATTRSAPGETADNPPVITSLTPSPSNVAPGESSTMTCVASDADGDTLSYTWSATGGTIAGVGSTATWVAPAVTGTFTISVTVADGGTGTATASCYVAVAATSTPPSSPSPWPMEITDDLDRTVVIDEPPQRIVSLAPSITETLFALDLGNKVMGVTDACDYPEEAKSKPSVGGYFMTNLEAIIAQDPDLVLADGHDPVCAQLEGLGITMVVLQPQDFAGIFGSIELVGEITGKEMEAERLIDEMKTHMAAICTKTASVVEKPTVFYEIDGSDPSKPWTVGRDSFIHTLITLGGGENMVTVSQAYFQISLEEIVDADPDIIILGDHPWVSPEDVMNRLGAWQELTAVQNEAIYPINVDLVSRPGPRIIDGLEEMATIIHPELFP